MPPQPAGSAPDWLVFVIVGAFFIAFPLIWCFVVWLLSRIGGWQRLAQCYAAGDRPVSGQCCKGIPGMVGGVSYRRVLTIHINPSGFFLDVMPMFKIGHPRLFIPWSDISARTPKQVLWCKTERLSIGRPVIGTITLPAELMDQHQGQ